MSCLTERSRSGVPICPRKYFETTMLVACCDQNARKLDVALLEDELAAFVGDDRRAQLPVDFVERIDAVLGEIPLELETRYRSSRTERPCGASASWSPSRALCACLPPTCPYRLRYTATRCPPRPPTRLPFVFGDAATGPMPTRYCGRRSVSGETLGGSRLRLLRCRRTNMRLVYSVVKTRPTTYCVRLRPCNARY